MSDLSITEYSYYYSLNNGNKSYVVSFLYTMKETIDKKVLKEAVDVTKKYFKRFSMKSVVTEQGNIVFVHNDNQVEIYSDINKHINVGTKESNYYLYRIVCDDNKINFSFSHLLGDGLTMINFSNNVLYHYYNIKGEKLVLNGDVRDEKKINDYDNALPIKIIESYDLSKDEEEKMKSLILNKDINNEKENYKLNLDDSLFEKKEFYIYRIVCDKNSFMDVVHKYDTTPLIFVFMLLANAIINIEHIFNKKITAGIAVDMRKTLSCKSDYNFGTLSFISYDTDYAKLSYDEQVKNIKENFKKYLDEKTLKFMCKLFIDLSDNDINSFNLNKIDNILGKLKNEYPTTSGGIFISNIGYIKLQEGLANHVQNVEFINTPTKNDYEVHILTYNNKITISLTINGEDKQIFKELHSLIEKFGIISEYRDCELIENDHMNPLLFEKN